MNNFSCFVLLHFERIHVYVCKLKHIFFSAIGCVIVFFFILQFLLPEVCALFPIIATSKQIIVFLGKCNTLSTFNIPQLVFYMSVALKH